LHLAVNKEIIMAFAAALAPLLSKGQQGAKEGASKRDARLAAVGNAANEGLQMGNGLYSPSAQPNITGGSGSALGTATMASKMFAKDAPSAEPYHMYENGAFTTVQPKAGGK